MAAAASDSMPEPVSIVDMELLLADPAAAVAWGRRAGLAEPEAAHRTMRGLAAQGITLDLLALLCRRLEKMLPGTSDPDRVLVAVDRLFAAVRSPLSTATLFERDPRSLEILLRLFSASPFLAELVILDPESWEEIRLGEGRPLSREALAAALNAEMASASEPEGVMRALRRFKRRETLRIAYGDIVAGQRLETVVSQLSHLADCVVQAALGAAVGRMESLRGVPRGPLGERVGIACLALGKLGGEELNYSSDIDLLFVYGADGRVEGPKPCDNAEFFERVVQETVRLLSEPTDLGFAYRVDLRLRPHGSTGPAAVAREPLVHYYDREGRTWERQAWVKARSIAGDAALGARVLADMQPWVYGRWLTRADIGGIQALKRQIERRAARQGVEATDVKSGRGGIRDIEFTIQFLQLLSGGDNRAVRCGNTLEAMRRLTESGALTDQERGILERTYMLLRSVEHRLQILYDRQTHRLPDDPMEFGRLAVRMGYGSGAEAAERLRRELVEAAALNRRILDHLLHDAFPEALEPEPEVDLVLDPAPPAAFVREVLGRHGFRDIDRAHRALVALGEERIRFLSSRRCRHFLAAIAGRLLAAVSNTPDPDATLGHLVDMSDSLGGKGVLWELFSVHPPSLDLTVRLCATSPFLTKLLVSNPGMIDELLDSLLMPALPTIGELDATLGEVCRNAVEITPMLHAFKASQQLRIGVRDILGRQDVVETTAALSAIPEAILHAVMVREEERLVERLGEPTAGAGDSVGVRAGAVVLAMGKFGGREMNYASDVDLIFLYDYDGISFHRRRTRRSVEGTTNAHFFGELAQRTMKVFNAAGPHGRLYEMDSRLRPSGRSGPSAVSLDDMARYFAEDGPAAVWERQALVKARAVIGGPAAAARAARIVTAAAYERTWTAREIAEIRRMRYRMEEGARATNLKRGPGGVVDIEFIAQAMQLVHGGREPAIRTPETLPALVALHAAALLPTDQFQFLADAYRQMRRIEGHLRLLDAPARHEFPSSGSEQRSLAHLMGYATTDELATAVNSLTARTRGVFEAVFDGLESRLG